MDFFNNGKQPSCTSIDVPNDGHNDVDYRQWLSIREMNILTAVSRPSLTKMCQQGRLNCIKVPQENSGTVAWHISVDEIEELKGYGKRYNKSGKRKKRRKPSVNKSYNPIQAITASVSSSKSSSDITVDDLVEHWDVVSKVIKALKEAR